MGRLILLILMLLRIGAPIAQRLQRLSPRTATCHFYPLRTLAKATAREPPSG